VFLPIADKLAIVSFLEGCKVSFIIELAKGTNQSLIIRKLFILFQKYSTTF
jgi:hypothetical protein